MLKGLIAIGIFIFNTSTAILHNTMLVVGDEAYEVGKIKKGKYGRVEIPDDTRDSIRVVFTLQQERKDWLVTDKLPLRNIIITDSTITYEVIFVEENLEDEK
jgi:hypothetical protein